MKKGNEEPSDRSEELAEIDRLDCERPSIFFQGPFTDVHDVHSILEVDANIVPVAVTRPVDYSDLGARNRGLLEFSIGPVGSFVLSIAALLL